jgi:thiamine biosynthesis lipoprotein
MNTAMTVWLHTWAANSQAIIADVESLFHSMDRRLSRFQATSELSQLNAHRGPFTASPVLFDVLKLALWAAEQTNGLFDPCILPALRNAGYARSFEQVSATGPALNVAAQPLRGLYQQISLQRTGYHIHKPAEVQLDLGGIAKGYTVDRAADRLRGLGPFFVNAGGDLYAYGSPPNSSGWQVNITHPQNEAHTLKTLRLNQHAVATSSITRRRWQRGQTSYHHLIDPRTGQPAHTDLAAVTVIAQRVALAEVFAKVALILGAEAGLAYLERLPQVEALLVKQDDTQLQTTAFAEFLA